MVTSRPLLESPWERAVRAAASQSGPGWGVSCPCLAAGPLLPRADAESPHQAQAWPGAGAAWPAPVLKEQARGFCSCPAGGRKSLLSPAQAGERTQLGRGGPRLGALRTARAEGPPCLSFCSTPEAGPLVLLPRPSTESVECWGPWPAAVAMVGLLQWQSCCHRTVTLYPVTLPVSSSLNGVPQPRGGWHSRERRPPRGGDQPWRGRGTEVRVVLSWEGHLVWHQRGKVAPLVMEVGAQGSRCPGTAQRS